MAIITTCCCCFNLRTGSIISGVYTAILAGINIVIVLANFGTSGDDGGVLTSNIINLLLFIALMVVSILLIYGVVKDKTPFLFPWIVFIIIYIVITLITLILLIVYLGIDKWATVLAIIWYIIFTTILVYCLLCVISQWQELKAGRGTVDYHRQMAAAGGRPVVVTTTTTS